MADGPRERDVQLNRERQLQEPYPNAAHVVDQLAAEKQSQITTPASQEPVPSGENLGMKTGVPSNYENSLGGEPRHLTAFEVKRPPGRL